MKLRRTILAWCVAGLVLAVSAVTRADDFKNFQPTGYVTDLAGIIKPQTKAQLEALMYGARAEDRRADGHRHGEIAGWQRH